MAHDQSNKRVRPKIVRKTDQGQLSGSDKAKKNEEMECFGKLRAHVFSTDVPSNTSISKLKGGISGSTKPMPS